MPQCVASLKPLALHSPLRLHGHGHVPQPRHLFFLKYHAWLASCDSGWHGLFSFQDPSLSSELLPAACPALILSLQGCFRFHSFPLAAYTRGSLVVPALSSAPSPTSPVWFAVYQWQCVQLCSFVLVGQYTRIWVFIFLLLLAVPKSYK